MCLAHSGAGRGEGPRLSRVGGIEETGSKAGWKNKDETEKPVLFSKVEVEWKMIPELCGHRQQVLDEIASAVALPARWKNIMVTTLGVKSAVRMPDSSPFYIELSAHFLQLTPTRSKLLNDEACTIILP